MAMCNGLNLKIFAEEENSENTKMSESTSQCPETAS
jgi:hypothetical protein